MYILNRLAVGNPPLGFRYLVKSSSFFRVVFRVLNRGLRLNLPGWGERRAAERGTGGGARDCAGIAVSRGCVFVLFLLGLFKTLSTYF